MSEWNSKPFWSLVCPNRSRWWMLTTGENVGLRVENVLFSSSVSTSDQKKFIWYVICFQLTIWAFLFVGWSQYYCVPPWFCIYRSKLTWTRNQEISTEAQGLPVWDVLLAGDSALPTGVKTDVGEYDKFYRIYESTSIDITVNVLYH